MSHIDCDIHLFARLALFLASTLHLHFFLPNISQNQAALEVKANRSFVKLS